MAPEALSFSDEQAAARAQAARVYTRFVWRACALILIVGVSLALALNLFYRLSVARTLHWPDSLPQPSMAFVEADPLMQAYIDADACLPPAPEDFACSLLLPWVSGDRQAVLGLLADPDTSAAAVAALELVLLEQLRDSVLRRDWATCAEASSIARAAIGRAEHPPWETSAERNQLLLLSAACEQPATVFREETSFLELLDAIIVGSHLDATFVDQVLQQRTPGIAAWRDYLHGLIALRAKRHPDARKSFAASAAAAASGGFSQLRELALLGQARAVYWAYVALAPGAQPSARGATQETLRLLHGSIRQASFRRDVAFYRAEIGR